MRALTIACLFSSVQFACSAPTAPSIGDARAIVTVRVLERADQVTPIAGARVQLTFDSVTTRALTDAAGRAELNVPLDRELTITVTAIDHQPFSVSGAVENSETWTFWLER